MKAMILAAGLGTRLRAMTATRPKALVQIGDRTLLELTLLRLREFGIRDVIINVHHFADMIVDFLKAHDNFGMRLEISREDLLLDTGGGLKKAGWFFANDTEPFILHNVDVISTIDFARMLEVHREKDALATLATQHRESSRYLIFDESGGLCGWRRVREQKLDMVRSSERTDEVAFSGIHIIAPRLIGMIHDSGTFSIIPTYLRLAGLGEKIIAFNADGYKWRDLGTPEHVAEARREFEEPAAPS
jgi:NDP-sugar pyrophosphorylase family protein